MCSQLQASIISVYMKQYNLTKMAAQMKLTVSERGKKHKLNPNICTRIQFYSNYTVLLLGIKAFFNKPSYYKIVSPQMIVLKLEIYMT